MGFAISSDLTASKEETNIRVGLGVRRVDTKVFTCPVSSEMAFMPGSSDTFICYEYIYVKTMKGNSPFYCPLIVAGLMAR